MEEEKICVERKDGIKYYRKAKNKDNIYDKKLGLRVSQDLIDNIRKIAENKGIGYNTLIRQIIENYIEENKEV